MVCEFFVLCFAWYYCGLYLLGLVFVVLMRNSVVDCGYFGFMLFCG